MSLLPQFLCATMLLLSAGDEPENPWKAKVPGALQRAASLGTVAALAEALDVTWRADDWEAGLDLARRVLRTHPDEDRLRGRVIRALWRAGRLDQAEKLAGLVPLDSDDPVALRALVGIHLARGALDPLRQRAAQLEKLDSDEAEDLYTLFAAQHALGEWKHLPRLLRRLERRVDAAHGYPELYLAEAVDGLAVFLDAVGPEPLNQIAQHGAAPMTPLTLVNLPACEVYINGHGPYHMIVDTGGSIMLSVDSAVADEIGLKSIAPATVRGVSGKQESGQALVDELRIGSIVCRRVLARTFPVRPAVMNLADGIVGTGLFATGRMTLDFAGAQLVVAPSAATPGPGTSVDVRIAGDAKLMVPAKLEGDAAVALLDTGADMVVLAPSRLRQIFPDRPIQEFRPDIGIGVGSGQMPGISLNPGVNLDIAGRKFEDYSGLGLDVLDTLLSPVIGIQTDVLIGMPTFRDMRSFTVDYPTCRLWVDWLAPRK